MRKWNYFLTLLVGATLTLTSCIDTTEPAGIEAMRTSKAEWLKAKAAYENAEAQLKLVKVEREKILLELDRIELELARMQSEAAKDSLLLAREKMLLDMYAQVAQAEQAYLEAVTEVKLALLTYKDDMFADTLKVYQDKLTAVQGELKTERGYLAQDQFDKWEFEYDRKDYIDGLPIDKAKKEKEIELQESYIAKLDSLDKIDVNDLTALYTQRYKYIEDIKALLKKREEMEDEITAMAKMEPETATKVVELEKKIAEVKKGYEEKHTITIAKADVSETMAARLYDWYNTTQPGNFAEAFNADKEMLADFNIYIDEQLLDVVEKPDNTLHSTAKKHYTTVLGKIDDYQNEYETQFNTLLGVTENPEFDKETGMVLPQYTARVNAELERLAIDATQVKIDYEKTLADWVAAYANYQNALNSFGAYGKNTAKYDKLAKEIAAYDDLDAGDKDFDAAVALRTKIRKFISDKNKVDGNMTSAAKSFMENASYGYAEDGTDNFDDVTAKVNAFNTFVASVANELTYSVPGVLGSKVPASSYSSTATLAVAAENGGILAKFLKLGNDLFGTTITSIADAVIPVENTIPEGYAPTGGIYGAYLTNTDPTQTDFLLEIDKWAALYTKMVAAADKAQEAYDAIDEEVTDLDDQIKELKKTDNLLAQWEKEFECYLIFGTTTAGPGTEIDLDGDPNTTDDQITSLTVYALSTGNPYDTHKGDMNIITEYDVIKDLLDLVNDAIAKADGTYWLYNPYTDEMESTTNLTTTIETAEDDLTQLVDDLKQIEKEIAMYEQFGNLDNAGTLQFYEDEIAEHEAKIEILEQRMKSIEQTIAAIIAAYEAGELDVTLPGVDEPADEPTDEPADEPAEGEGESSEGGESEGEA